MTQIANIERYNRWINTIRETGGVSDHGQDIADAITAATSLCWDVYRDNNAGPRNEMAQLGVKYLAAYMVSSVKHGTNDTSPLAHPRTDLEGVFWNEAAKNVGMLNAILSEASSCDDRLRKSALFAAGVYFQVKPTARGKGVGRI